MEQEGSEGMHEARMESNRILLVYLSIMYIDMKPCFKGVILMLNIWIPYIHVEGWRLWGEEI